MKRFIAICLLVVCVALPLISWGVTYQCPKCGSYRTALKTLDVPLNTFHYDSYTHEKKRMTVIMCMKATCQEHTVIESSYYDEPHIMQTKVIDRIPSLNLKQVEHSCAVCRYKYTTYEPIDPSKPYGTIHN